MGTPEEATWPGVTSLKNYNDKFPDCNDVSLSKKVSLRGFGFELLQLMLIYNPSKRISAKQILKHRYFNGFDPKKRYPPLKKEPKTI